MSVYRVLPTHLHSTADAAAKFIAAELGLPQSSVKTEAEINPAVDFRPTLQAITPEKQIVCIEVVEYLYPPEINAFVLSCRNHSIPAKLYCAISAGTLTQVDTRALQFASENGIAILEMNPLNGHGKVLNQPPTALSLGGLRQFKLTDYPPKYRAPLRAAIDTFRAGNPAKGCSQVYDEIEQLCRRIGKKCSSTPGALKNAAGFDWNTHAWHAVVEFLKINIQSHVISCPLLKAQLWSRISGLTEYRNEAGHKPNTVQKMIERDIALKTRFESAMDELAKLIDASKPLKP